jgi:transcriptional regulator CtsR
MRNISEEIERYIKQILQHSSENAVDIQRNELAEKFQCVPSQINYVIATRFTLEKGYLIESKRGGGGYIRIQKIELSANSSILEFIFHTIQSRVDQSTAEGLIYQLHEGGIISHREAYLIQAAIHRDVLELQLPLRDQIRANILKSMFISLLDKKGES